jgi:hypothetical protein
MTKIHDYLVNIDRAALDELQRKNIPIPGVPPPMPDFNED